MYETNNYISLSLCNFVFRAFIRVKTVYYYTYIPPIHFIYIIRAKNATSESAQFRPTGERTANSLSRYITRRVHTVYVILYTHEYIHYIIYIYIICASGYSGGGYKLSSCCSGIRSRKTFAELFVEISRNGSIRPYKRCMPGVTPAPLRGTYPKIYIT